MTVLPISNIINVTVQGAPSGVNEKNVNSIALFTNESHVGIDDYIIAQTYSQVTDYYDSDSVTAKMASNIFAQTPNINTGDGRLVIIPLQSAVSAVAGKFATADISANLSDIYAVKTGDLKVTVNGTDLEFTGIDFSGSDSIDDVATILQKKLQNVTVTANDTTITFMSKKVGESSTISLGAVTGGTGIDLSGAGYLNATGGTDTDGSNSSGETIVDAITRVSGDVGFVGVMTNIDIEDTVIETIADSIQAQDMIFLHHFASTEDIAGIATTISDASQSKTRCLLFTDSLAEANLFKAGYVGKAFSTNFSGSNTAQTMNLKSLSNVNSDTGITQTNYSNADTAGIDLYVSYNGVASVYSTGGNDYFDNVYMDLAIKFAFETAGFNYLRQTNTKIQQTENGMNGLKNSYSQVCIRYVRNGCIASGAWNSSEKFGDPDTFDNNISSQGYYIYSTPIDEQSSVDREGRKAPLVQIAIKRAGAIHTSDVIVTVND